MTLPSARFGTLQRLDLFRSLSLPEIDAFASVARERWLEPGDALVREGELGETLAFVVQGELAVRLGSLAGSHAEIAALRAGAVVGEGSFVDPGPRSATVVACVPTVVVEVDRPGFDRLLLDHPRVASRLLGAILQEVARRLHAVDRRIAIELGEVGAFAPLTPSDAPRPDEPERSTLPWRRASARPAERPRVTPAELRACGVSLHSRDEDLAELIAACTERRFEAGQVLSTQGSEARSCFIIVSGEVAVVKVLLQSERVLTVLGPGSIAGQAALIDPSRRSSMLRASTPGVALELGADAFERLVHECGAAAVGLQRHVAAMSVRQLRAADLRLAAVLAREDGDESVDDPTPRLAGLTGASRRQRDLQYIQAAVKEVEMNLDVIELTDDDLGADEPPRRPFFTPPPLPHRSVTG